MDEQAKSATGDNAADYDSLNEAEEHQPATLAGPNQAELDQPSVSEAAPDEATGIAAQAAATPALSSPDQAISNQVSSTQDAPVEAAPEPATQSETPAVEIAPSQVPAVVPAAAPAVVPAKEAPRGNSKNQIERPFRVKLRGSVLVLVRLPNKRDVRAAFHQLSVTGGVVHLEKPLDEKLGVEMVFHINGATVREKAQMLFPMWATQGWMQPFRFVDMTDANRELLDGHLKTFLGQGAPAAKSAAAGA